MQIIKTRKFDRLPNITGIPFSGLDEAKIESRDVIEKEIKSFIEYCRDNPEGVAARFILGDWGEGKTDTYKRIIQPEIKEKGDYLFFLSASRLVNSYGNQAAMNFAKYELLEDVRFLAHVFNSIKAGSGENVDELPDLMEIKHPKSYVNKTLDTLLDGKKDKKIFIFIDEFEELLQSPRTLKKVVSGLKEAINGEYEALKKDGKYGACIHFFISCTPDAYYKIQVHEDTRLIMGGVDRRIDKIKLTDIKREEGLNYLMSLLNYSYYNKLPEPFPIKNLALFNTILRVSQGNLGNLTSLFSNLFSYLRDDEFIEVLNYENLIKFLENSQISVYNAQTPCIDKNNYNSILDYLEDQIIAENGNICKKIFKQLIGELRPFGDEELENILSINDPVSNYIDMINKDVNSNEGITAIIKVSSLKDGKTFNDLKKALKKYNYINTEGNRIQIDNINYSEDLEEFKEKITFYELNNKKDVVPKIYLPYEEKDIKVFFKNEIETNSVLKNLCKAFSSVIKDNEMYIASDLILNYIYPSPVPHELMYFKDKVEKLKLWRQINHNLNNEYENNIFDAFKTVLEESEAFRVNIEKNVDNFPVVNLNYIEEKIQIRMQFSIVNGDIKGSHIQVINKKLEDDLSKHASILLYNGEFTENANNDMEYLGINENYSIIRIQLHPSLAKKILFAHKSLEYIDNEEKYIEKDTFKASCRELIDDMDLKARISEWIKIQEKRGLIINQIKLKKSPNPKVFADGLKLYLNYPEPHSPEEIYEKNFNGVLKFRKYGGKGFIASDLEDIPSIIKVSEDLSRNGLLEERDGAYILKENAIEERIFEIIKNEKMLSIEKLKKCFIIRDRNERIFEDIFINILKYKGKIIQKGDNIELVDKNELINELKEKYHEYKESIDNKDFKTFGHYYERKQRDDKLIMLDEFDNYLTGFYNEIENSFEDENTNLKMGICIKLIKLFNENFKEAIEYASDNAPTLIYNLKDKKEKLEELIDVTIVKSEKWLKIRFKKENLIEYKGIIEDYNEIKEIYDKNYSKDDLKNEINLIEQRFRLEYGDKEYKDKLMEIFGFKKYNKTKPHFNIKFHILDHKKDKLSEKINKMMFQVKHTNSIFDQIENRQNDLKNRLEKVKKLVSKENKLSYYMYKQLEKADINYDRPIRTMDDGLDLSSLHKSCETSINKMGDQIELIGKFTDYIENLNKSEADFSSTLKKMEIIYQEYTKKCDINRFDNDLSKFDAAIKEYMLKYNEMDMDEIKKDEKNRKDLPQILKGYTVKLRKNKDAIELEWDDYQSENIKFAFKFDKIISILSKKEELSDDELNINNKINKLKEISKKGLNNSITANEIEKYKEKLNEETMEIICKYLTDDERNLLLAMESRKSGWMNYEEIKTLIEKDDLDESSFDEAMKGLVSKGYLQRGFLLTI